MKILKNILYIFFIGIIFSSTSCEETQIETGDGTFSCFVNGNLFVPKVSFNLTRNSSNNGLSFYRINFSNDMALEVHSNNNKLVIYIKDDRTSESLNFNINEGLTRYNYPYGTPETSAILLLGDKVYASKDGSGFINFIENSSENIEGTFAFTLYETTTGEVLEVTSGQFNS